MIDIDISLTIQISTEKKPFIGFNSTKISDNFHFNQRISHDDDWCRSISRFYIADLIVMDKERKNVLNDFFVRISPVLFID